MKFFESFADIASIIRNGINLLELKLNRLFTSTINAAIRACVREYLNREQTIASD
jgi:hypothetical protein